jgi:hypothetical protein
MSAENIGAICFGLVVGWVTYRALKREKEALLSDLATVVGVVGGGVVTGIFKSQTLFGLYAIGLAVGFFLYLLINLLLYGKDGVVGWMGVHD